MFLLFSRNSTLTIPEVRHQTSAKRANLCKHGNPNGQKRPDRYPKFCQKYCWWKKSCTTWDVQNLVNNGIDYQPQLVQDFFHQQYVCCVISGGTTKKTKPFGGVRGENSNGGVDSIAWERKGETGGNSKWAAYKTRGCHSMKYWLSFLNRDPYIGLLQSQNIMWVVWSSI